MMPFYNQQRWHYEMINLPAAWDRSLGDNTIVAVIDTGILSTHPDLEGQLVSGYDFVSPPSLAQDGDGIDPDPEDPGGEFSAAFHGTHVAGTVAAATNNAPLGSSLGRGVAGVAWNAKVMPLRALGSGGWHHLRHPASSALCRQAAQRFGPAAGPGAPT